MDIYPRVSGYFYVYSLLYFLIVPEIHIYLEILFCTLRAKYQAPFLHRYSVFPVPFVDEAVLSLKCTFDFVVKNQVAILDQT